MNGVIGAPMVVAVREKRALTGLRSCGWLVGSLPYFLIYDGQLLSDLAVQVPVAQGGSFHLYLQRLGALRGYVATYSAINEAASLARLG
jgi:hypothetical protein